MSPVPTTSTGRVRRFLEIRDANYRNRGNVIESVHEWIGPDPVEHELTAHDLEALMAERNTLTKRVAELEAELASLGRPTTEWGIRERPGAESVEHSGFTTARLKAIAEETPGGSVTVRTAYRGPWRDADDWELR